MPATCSCGRHWTGMSQAHCGICHAHFSTVANFDRHKPSYNGCGNPAEVRNRKGETILKLVEGPFGGTWTGLGSNDAPENAAAPAMVA